MVEAEGIEPRPSACKADALPAELSLRNKATFIISKSDIRSKCFKESGDP